MENLTGLLCMLFALIAKGRVTFQNLRRFVECPERLDDDWDAATVEEHLARIAVNPHLTGTFGNYAPHLRQDLEGFARAHTPSRERLSMMIAHTGFVLGVKHGLALPYLRWWFDGQDHGADRDPLSPDNIRLGESRAHKYQVVADIAERLLRGDRVSPFELIIEFETGGHALELIGESLRLPREYWPDQSFDLSGHSDDALQTIVDQYWQPYIERAHGLLGATE